MSESTTPTVTTEIRLTGTTEYNPKFPPRDAKKGYVARIKGRVPGPMKYDREFFGESVTVLPGDQGLYERQIGDKKGGQTRYYHVILSHPEHGLILSVDCEAEVPKIAKLLAEGVSIADAVEVSNLRPSERVEGRMVFDAVSRTASGAKKAAKGTSLAGAIEVCWEVLKLLPEKEAKAAMKELRNRIKPPTAGNQPSPEATALEAGSSPDSSATEISGDGQSATA